MYFIAILIVLALLQYRSEWIMHLQNDNLFAGLCRHWASLVPAGSNPHLLLSVLTPVLLLGLLLALFGKMLWGLPGLLLALLTLAYALGRGDYSSRFGQYRQAWLDDAPQRIPAILQALDPQQAIHANATAAELHVQARCTFIYSAFTRLFVVLFWFALAGPMLALLYRLLRLYAAAHASSTASLLIAALEWPVVRVFGITVALLGNFSSTLAVWLASALNTGMSARRILHELCLAALGQDMQWQQPRFLRSQTPAQQAASAQAEITAIEVLLKRCLVFAVVVIALLHVIL